MIHDSSEPNMLFDYKAMLHKLTMKLEQENISTEEIKLLLKCLDSVKEELRREEEERMKRYYRNLTGDKLPEDMQTVVDFGPLGEEIL